MQLIEWFFGCSQGKYRIVASERKTVRADGGQDTRGLRPAAMWTTDTSRSMMKKPKARLTRHGRRSWNRRSERRMADDDSGASGGG